MSSLAVALFTSVCFVVTFAFAFYYWEQSRYSVALWWTFASWVLIGLAILAGLFPTARAYDAAKTGDAQTVLDRLAEQQERELRPYLQLVEARLIPLVVGRNPVVVIEIQNSGKTPAVDVMAGTALQIGDFAFFPDGGYYSVDGPRVTIGPSGGKTILAIERDRHLTAGELQGVKGGLKELIAHGELRFTSDPPPKQPFQPFRFCTTLDPRVDSMIQCDNRGFINRDKSKFR